jgi:predicted nucleic acid-binding protein
VLNLAWVGEEAHTLASTVLAAANRRRLSLVDVTSFAVMRRLGIETAFTFDPHFAEQGFSVIPGE